jgi:predicted porin
MKKQVIAGLLAAAGATGAWAQSSVTLYGIVDIGVQWNEYGVNKGSSSAPNYAQESVWGIDSGYQSGSRFGLRGSEALGGGWSAAFTLEGGFNVDTGSSGQGGLLFGRQAWLGMQQSAIGTFAFGRIATPSSTTGSFDMFARVDPFSGGFGLNQIGSTFIAANSGVSRWDNSVIWASPSWAGFKLAAQYSFNTNTAETAPSDTNTSAYSLAGSWGWNWLYIVATYDVYQFASTGTRANVGNPDEKLFQIGTTLDFKFVKLYGAYARQDNIASSVQTNLFPGYPIPVVAYDNNAWMLGVTVPLLGGNIRASYQYSDGDNVNTATYQFEPDYSVWGIGFDYPFSRRTNVYVGYGQREWDGTIVQTPLPLSTPSQRVDRSQFAMGIRHLF